jgi:outer membrane protein TolC
VNDYPISTTSDEKLIEKKLELNNSEMKGLKYALLPSLGIYGLYGTTGFGNTGSNSFFNFYEIGFVGIQLNIPLFNGLSTHRKIEQKAIDIEKNTMMKDLLTEKISLETKNAKMQYEVMKKNIETSFKQISLAKSIFDNTVIQSKQGVASVTDILLADNSLRESQQNYIVAMANLRKAELELKRISGNLLNY